MKDLLVPLARSAAAFFYPLRVALSRPDELLAFLERLGFELSVEESIDDLFDTEGLYGGFAELVAEINAAIETAEGLARTLANDPASVDIDEVVALLDTLRDIPAMIAGFKGPARPSMPEFLDQDEIWDSLTEELPELLLADYLSATQPKFYALLENLGLVQRVRITPTGLLRKPYVLDDFRWDYIGDLLDDPVTHLKEVYGFDGHAKPDGGPDWLNYRPLLEAVQSLLTAGAIPARIEPMDQALYADYFPPALFGDEEAATRPRQLTVPLYSAFEPDIGRVNLALVVAPIPEPGQGSPAGLVISHHSSGSVGSSIAIAEGFDLAVSGDLDADHLLRLEVLASGVEVENSAPGTPSLGLALTGTPQTDSGRWGLIGDPGGTGVSLGELSAGLSFGDVGGAPDLTFEATATDLVFQIKAGEGDSFINAILAAVDISASMSLGLAYSARNGLSLAATGGSLGGPDGFTFDVPLSLNLGPFTLDGITLNVAGIDSGFSLTGLSHLAAVIGPFSAEVKGLGLAFDLIEVEDGPGVIGPFDLNAGFRPPSRIALSLSTEAVKGGGFLEITETRYSGALMLEALSVGIAAITVIDTELPGDPDEWSFFAALTLTFPALPLGFGFSLTGLGGLIALNREFDDIALASALKTGAADALLFPDDPIGDAAAIISQIDTYFPPMQGNTVIGPLVQIGWGVPTPLITAELGVIVSLPQGIIALLGSVSALLPKPEAPLLTLKMDILGSVNVPDGTMMMLASLYDSKLLATIELSGDMGMFLATKHQPYFLMSVGGYNPGFRPPALVPASLQNLRRMQAKIELGGVVEVRITNYFAVTSNAIQFGSEVYMEAEAEIGPVTFLAKGDLAFHVFLRFSPFLIKADFEASVGIYVGGAEVLSAYLTAHLEGPDPWYALGTAGFKFLGKEIDFEVEVGSKAPPENKPLVYLRDDVLVALADPANWREVVPPGEVSPAITYLDPEDDDGRLWVRPDCGVEVGQGAGPLHRTIDKVGQGLPAPGHERIEIDVVLLGGQEVVYEGFQDWFAPAQFENIGKNEKLTRASFEMMDAGVALSRPDLSVTPHVADLGREVEVGYEEVLFEPEIGPAKIELPEGSLGLSAYMSGAGQALRRPARSGGPGRFTLSESPYVVVDPLTGEVDTNALVTSGLGPSGGNQHAARQVSGGTLLAVPLSVGGRS